MTDKISVSEPNISKEDINSVVNALKSGWVSGAGPFVAKFEKEFARRVAGTKYAIAVNSGSSALQVALSAAGIASGDEVIMPTFTMVATANAVSFIGANPILVDADPNTWNIDVKAIEGKITKKTKAIVAVHIYGLACDMDAINKIAKKHHLLVIEDAAEAQGAEFRGKKVGGIGVAGAFSFYGNKIITTGEGGMVTTNSKKLAFIASKLRNNGIDENRHFWHKYKGYGFKMSNLQAALGFSQTLRFKNLLQKRRENAALYKRLLGNTPGITFPEEPKGYKNCYWMFGVVIDPKKTRVSAASLRKKLAEEGIETRTFFIPIHLQPIYYKEYRGQKFPISERLSQEGFYLPSSFNLTKKEIQRVCNIIRSSIK